MRLSMVTDSFNERLVEFVPEELEIQIKFNSLFCKIFEFSTIAAVEQPPGEDYVVRKSDGYIVEQDKVDLIRFEYLIEQADELQVFFLTSLRINAFRNKNGEIEVAEWFLGCPSPGFQTKKGRPPPNLWKPSR